MNYAEMCARDAGRKRQEDAGRDRAIAELAGRIEAYKYNHGNPPDDATVAAWRGDLWSMFVGRTPQEDEALLLERQRAEEEFDYQ
jgi:hypothetical protein